MLLAGGGERSPRLPVRGVFREDPGRAEQGRAFVFELLEDSPVVALHEEAAQGLGERRARGRPFLHPLHLQKALELARRPLPEARSGQALRELSQRRPDTGPRRDEGVAWIEQPPIDEVAEDLALP